MLWFHGFGADTETHREELRQLGQAGFLAVGVDAAGHGARRLGRPPDRASGAGAALFVVTKNPGLPASARVVNADLQGTFTAANQDHFQYPEMLSRLQESNPRRWKIQFGNADTFEFSVMISAATFGSGGDPGPRHDQGGGG